MEEEPIEQWRPGKVEINKLAKGFPYLVVPGFFPPPSKLLEPPDPSVVASPAQLIVACSAPFAVASLKRARRRGRIKEHHAIQRQDKEVINMAIQEAMLDSGATSNFIKSAEGLKLTGLSSKLVSIASRSTMKATNTALLPIDSLKPAAREAFVIPELGTKALMSVKKLADNGYTTIFHPHQNGVTVHNDNDFELKVNKPAVLQGWRDEAGLWTVPFVDEQEINPGLNVEEGALNVYELPTTKQVVRFLHGALGFPTQATLLTSA